MNKDRFISMLLIDGFETVPATRLVAELQRQFLSLPGPVEAMTRRGEQEAEQGSYLLKIGDVVVTIVFIDAPIPFDTFNIALASNYVWEGAGAGIRAHKAHAIVTHLQTPTDHVGKLNTARIITLVAAALAGLVPALGIFWDTAQTITETSQFRADADAAVTGQIPTEVWIGLQFFEPSPSNERAPRLGALTTGLAAVVGREIEFDPVPWPPSAIAQCVMGTAQYLIENGPVIKDGDTISLTADERTMVQYAAQGLRPNLPILSLKSELLSEAMPNYS